MPGGQCGAVAAGLEEGRSGDFVEVTDVAQDAVQGVGIGVVDVVSRGIAQQTPEPVIPGH
ncbi:hypothetical protein GCM10027519_43290 [Kineococcus endophyticus]